MKKLFIGLDLSFNSTGICVFSESENKIQFYRVVYETKPHDIENINQVTYRMPDNISTEDLLIDSDKNNQEQIESTIRAMICSKKIINILKDVIIKYEPDQVTFCIENYIMPSFGGPNSLRNVSGLLLLQGYIREFIIRYATSNKVYLITPTPSQNKKFFTGKGKSDKSEMLKAFIDVYDGLKLIPNLTRGKLDDVIDAFSLMVYAVNKNRYGTKNI